MKVSVLTQPLGHNYGGLMQAYALQRHIEKLGCEVETLDRRKAPRSMLKRVRRSVASKLGLSSTPQPHATQCHLQAFRDQYIRLSDRVTSESQLRRYYKKHSFDAVVVGSDQVWRPKYSPSITNYYLDFLDDIGSRARRIAYAASFGVSDWEYSAGATLVCRSLIHRFDAVSVREQSAVGLCEQHFGLTPEWVLDPTMLLSAAEYRALIPADRVSEHAGNIVSYVLDPSPELEGLAHGLSRASGHRHTALLGDASQGAPLPRVEHWLQAIDQAQFVVTDSFHGCVFSILFNTPFVAVGNAARGMARFESLLSQFGLEQRLVSSQQDCDRCFHEQTIDWQRVNGLLASHAEHSKAFLAQHLLSPLSGPGA